MALFNLQVPITVIFKEIYYNFTKNFIEHNLFPVKSYTNMSKGRPRRTLILFELFKIEIRVNRSILLSLAQILSPRPDAPVALTRLKANSVISFQNLAAHMTSLVEQWRHCLAGISNIRKYYRKLINKTFFIYILIKIFNQKTYLPEITIYL